MKSEAHSVLHTTFAKLEVGDFFQLVNSVMGTILRDSQKFQKIETVTDEKGFTFNAIVMKDQLKVRIRDTAFVMKGIKS